MSSAARYQLNPTPTPDAENEPSIVDDEIVANVTAGEDTEELSDISEGEDATSSSKSSSVVGSWYRRIAPLMRNKQVRILSIINFAMAIINMFILFLILAFCFWLLGLKIKCMQLLEQDMPCLYEFEPWSDCSASCWDVEKGYPMPYMVRRIDESKLVNSRGTGYAKCPSNVRKGLIQRAPCNLQKCPQRLSTFNNWTHCMHKDPMKRKAGGCYQMRKLPLLDLLIEIDTAELSRDCATTDCADYIP